MAITSPAPALTLRSATDLAAAIRGGEVSAREVVQAHVDRLHARQPRTNALACDRFVEALAEADAADARVKAGGELPPFLGVPCTIKESISVKGMPNCAGLVARRERRSETNAPAVQRLIDAGFIPLGVTNTSEMTMWIESDNRVYGRTRNAYDPHRTAGGSSGGEGAAVGSGGSPVGLGSDIGGSIRLPAFFNGVFGHKPSPGLVPNTGQFPSTEGEAAYMLTLGPLARHAEDLMPVTKLIAGPDGRGRALRRARARRPAARRPREDARPARRRRLAPAGQEGAARRPRPSRQGARGPRRQLRAHLAQAAPARARDLPRRARGRSRHVAGRAARGGRRAAASDHPWREAARGRGDHTLPVLITLTLERAQPARARRPHPEGAGRRPGAPGGGPRASSATTGSCSTSRTRASPRATARRSAAPGSSPPPRSSTCSASPSPRSRSASTRKGLPLGVQVAAADGNDHLTIAAALALEKRFGGWVPPAGR